MALFLNPESLERFLPLIQGSDPLTQVYWLELTAKKYVGGCFYLQLHLSWSGIAKRWAGAGELAVDLKATTVFSQDQEICEVRNDFISYLFSLVFVTCCGCAGYFHEEEFDY